MSNYYSLGLSLFFVLLVFSHNYYFVIYVPWKWIDVKNLLIEAASDMRYRIEIQISLPPPKVAEYKRELEEKIAQMLRRLGIEYENVKMFEIDKEKVVVIKNGVRIEVEPYIAPTSVFIEHKHHELLSLISEIAHAALDILSRNLPREIEINGVKARIETLNVWPLFASTQGNRTTIDFERFGLFNVVVELSFPEVEIETLVRGLLEEVRDLIHVVDGKIANVLTREENEVIEVSIRVEKDDKFVELRFASSSDVAKKLHSILNILREKVEKVIVSSE